VTKVGDRAYIEVRGIHRTEADQLRAAIESALASCPAVHAVETIAVLRPAYETWNTSAWPGMRAFLVAHRTPSLPKVIAVRMGIPDATSLQA